MRLISSLCLLGFSPFILCHESAMQDDHLSVKSSIGWQSSEVAAENGLYYPGVMLGGEATPTSKGFVVEDVQLLAFKKLHSEFFVSSNIAYHQHAGSGELELEAFSVGKSLNLSGSVLKLEAGKMSSDLTPTANYHPSQDFFSDTPLLAKVFFGGHHKDTGIRATWLNDNLEAQFEAFNGDNWPYSSGETLIQAAIKSKLEFSNQHLNFALWSGTGQVKNRTDTRYNHDHAHGITAEVNPFDFTGDVTQSGFLAQWDWSLSSATTLNAEFEWINQQQDGVISDETQNGQLEQTLDGYRLNAGFTYRQHQIQLETEWLVVDNAFTETSSLLAEQTGLINHSVEPSVTKVAYLWNWQPDFTLRVQFAADDTQTNKAEHIFYLGFLWQHKLL